MVCKVLVGIDRDGTINVDDGFFGCENDWSSGLEFHKGVVEGLRLLNDWGDLKVVVATDQGSGLSRGFYDLKRVNEVNLRILNVLKSKGVRIDSGQSGLYVGYDYAIKHCIKDYEKNKWVVSMNDSRLKDRKSGIGMLEKGVKELGFELSDFDKIYFIGDKVRDVETGVNAGGKGILVYNGVNREAVDEIRSRNDSRQIAVNDFYEACKLIVDEIKGD